MSSELIKQFIDAMSAAECQPANTDDIKADDKRNYFQIAGDKPGRKRGAYKLKIDESFGCGWFVDYRNGEVIKWHSKTNRKFTPAERADWKKRIEAERAIKDKEQAEIYRLTATKAKRLWDGATRTGTTEYLTRKQINLNGARIMRGLVVVGAFKDGQVSTLQFIAADGEKRFLKDGEKSGSYFPLAKGGEDLSRLILCEGYATACSIREATGLPVVCAFDAGNLSPVSKILRDKYPDSEIILAADNDAWTTSPKFKPKGIDIKSLPHDSPFWDEWGEAGHLHNTGVVSAQQAALAIGGARVVIPRFLNTSSKPTDWNDLFILEGSDKVRAAFITPDTANAPPEDAETPTQEDWENYYAELPSDQETAALVQLYTAAPEVRASDVDWRSKLAYKENGNLQGNSIQNSLLLIENDKVLKNIYCFDSFSQEMTVYQCPPWEDAQKFRPHILQDSDVTFLTGYMEKLGLKLGQGQIQKSLHAIVRKNSKNPAQEYFNSLKWDGVRRLDTWLQDYCGAILEPQEYVSAIGRKWLCASVRRVMEPGTKFDHMLILEGAQGIRKSTLLRELATIHGKAYFDDTLRIEHLTDSKYATRFQGKLIIEIAELAGIHRADVEKLKGALSVQDDSITLKYENNTTKYPRQFIIGGTVNPQEGNGYLSDPTGNRRFWPVSTNNIKIEGIREIKEQLWAEAASVAKNEELYLTGKLAVMQSEVVALRLNEHPWSGEITRFSYGRRIVEKEEIWTLLGVTDRTKRTTTASNEIGKIMTKLGYKNKQVMAGGDREYKWVKDVKDEEIGL
ncbi:MAG: VapE domain-containing protein [Alphaproteobacteria bacterium]